MKSRMMIGLLVIAIVAAVIGGGTMAWFTAKADAPEAIFTAGTVMIDADSKFDFDEQFTNINPGDCICAGWEFVNTGSKAIRLRVVGEGNWDFLWDYIWDNREALCYTDEWENYDAMKVDPMFDAGDMGHPDNPVIVVPCPYSDYEWYVILVDGDGNITVNYQDVAAFHMYYSEEIPAYDEDNEGANEVQLCLCVFFSGPRMTNIFQGATFTLSGQAQAIQASNNAPSAVWGADWNVDDDDEFWVLIGVGITDPRISEIDFSKCVGQDGLLAPCCTPDPQ